MFGPVTSGNLFHRGPPPSSQIYNRYETKTWSKTNVSTQVTHLYVVQRVITVHVKFDKHMKLILKFFQFKFTSYLWVELTTFCRGTRTKIRYITDDLF